MHAPLSTRQFRLLSALMLALLATGSLEAESPWSRLTQIISSRPDGARGRAQQVTDRAVAAQHAADADALPPAVPNEGQPAVVSGPVADGTQFAALNPSQPLGEFASTGPTGLAVEGAGSDTTIDLGRESDEDASLMATNLFKNPEMLRLLGDQPRFVYDPAGKQDPMLVPWVRNAAIYTELSGKAEELIKSGDTDGAVALFNRILEMGDARFTVPVQARLAELQSKQQLAEAQVAQAAVAAEAKIELPSWVTDNTTGVIVSPGQEMALVGDHLLHVGDTLPNYPDVKVAAIATDKVTYQVQDKSFEVELKDEE